MNKTLLIIVCDFLLISLLSLARFETDEPPPTPDPAPTAGVTAEEDLNELLKSALEEERLDRERLARQLAQTQEALETQEQLLAQGAQGLRHIHENLRRREQDLKQLEQERAALREQFIASRVSADALQKKLSSTESEAQLSRERLQAMQAELRAREAELQAELRNREDALQAELRQREAEAERLRRQMAELDNTRQAAERERHQLATQLEVTETEKRLAQEQVQLMRSEVQVVREEKARIEQQTVQLAEGVSALAQKSGELTEEIRQNRPMAANAIFSDFVANRVQSDFLAIRSGRFGREIVREKETKTVLVTDGSNIYAIFHVQDTPLALADPGTDWTWLTGNVRRKGAVVPVRQVSFLNLDPRVLLVPVTTLEAQELGSKIYRVSKEPFKFQEAVLVGANEGYYGEAKFQIDPELPQYVRMERSAFRALFGRFAPTRGDLVFSKTGELLGIMVNHEYCLLINGFPSERTINTGNDITKQQTGQTLAALRWRLDRLPSKVH
jgi:hypothetical protein